MSATLFALALFACSDDGTTCQRLSGVPEQTYATKESCVAHLDEAMMSEPAMKADAPSVFGQCMSKSKLASLGKTFDLTKVSPPMFASAMD